jgi:hypothetical protein
MKKSVRYDTAGLIEDQYEPGSRRRVLKNLQGIISKRAMERIETHELLRTADAAIARYTRDHVFTAEDIGEIHRDWLGKNCTHGPAGTGGFILVKEALPLRPRRLSRGLWMILKNAS